MESHREGHARKPLHIVMISRDASLCQDSPSRRRHRSYLDAMRVRDSDAKLSIVVIGRRATVKTECSDHDIEDGIDLHLLTGGVIWQVITLVRKIFKLFAAGATKLVPQVVYQEGLVVLACGRWLGIPCIGQIHIDFFSGSGARLVFGSGVRAAVLRCAVDWALRRFDAVRVVSPHLRDAVLHVAPKASVFVIPVPMTLATNEAVLSQDATGERGRTVLFVGRFVAQKNLEFWLDVAVHVRKEIPDVRFEWVGDGPLAGALMHRVRELGLIDSFTWSGGWLEGGALAATYRRATVFLLTSVAEGFGRVLVEAASYGIPIVSNRLPSAEWIVASDKSGFLYLAQNPAATAALVNTLLSKRDLARQFGEYGRARALPEFAPERLCAAWVALLSQS